MAEPLQGRRPKGERFYRLPVVGYLIRLIAAVVNLPHILRNLERHYTVVGSDRTRTDTQFGALRHELAQMAETFDARLEAAERTNGEALLDDLRALRAELRDLKDTQAARLEAAQAESARLRTELELLRAAFVRLACTLPELDPVAEAPVEDDLIRALPPRSPMQADRPGRPGATADVHVLPVAWRREGADDAGGPVSLEQVGDLTQETALALTALPSGAAVLDFGGADRGGYARALRVFGLQPRRPDPEELNAASTPDGACGAVWVDNAPSLTLDGLERALSVLGGRLPRDAVTVVRGGNAGFEPSLANLIAGHRGFRLKRMLSAPEGSTALVLLRD